MFAALSSTVLLHSGIILANQGAQESYSVLPPQGSRFLSLNRRHSISKYSSFFKIHRNNNALIRHAYPRCTKRGYRYNPFPPLLYLLSTGKYPVRYCRIHHFCSPLFRNYFNFDAHFRKILTATQLRRLTGEILCIYFVKRGKPPCR